MKGTRLGELAVARGFLTRDELEDAIRTRDHLLQEGKNKPLGEVLVEKGYLRQAQLEALTRLREEEGKMPAAGRAGRALESPARNGYDRCLAAVTRR